MKHKFVLKTPDIFTVDFFTFVLLVLSCVFGFFIVIYQTTPPGLQEDGYQYAGQPNFLQ